MKSNIGIAVVALYAAIGLTGCVIVIGDEGDDGAYWASEYDDHRDSRHEKSEQIMSTVRDGFESDEFIRNEDIRIAARDGVVTLSGEASSADALDRALRLAAATEGVESVVSRVVVVVHN